jgi:hypothetical protein
MKQITAVDWLGAAIQLHLNFSNGKLTDESFNGLFKQAKEMEKEQIIEAHEEGFYSPPFRMSRRKEAEDYYNETFKSE